MGIKEEYKPASEGFVTAVDPLVSKEVSAKTERSSTERASKRPLEIDFTMSFMDES